jgi:hypothetical protein
MTLPRDLPRWNQDDPPPWRERALLVAASLGAVLLSAGLIRVLVALQG